MSRAYALALFTFLFCLSISMLNTSMAFSGNTGMSIATPPIKPSDYGNSFFNRTVNQSTPISNTMGNSGIANVFSSTWNIIQGFGLMTKILSQATIGFESMLAEPPFNLPAELLTMILAVRVFIYSWWIISFIAFRYSGE